MTIIILSVASLRNCDLCFDPTLRLLTVNTLLTSKRCSTLMCYNSSEASFSSICKWPTVDAP